MGSSVSTINNGLTMELARPVKSAHTDTLNAKNEYIRNTLAPLEREASEEAKLAANESLSHQGKAQAIKTFATRETVPALAWIRKEIERLQAKDQRYRTQFFTIDSGLKDPTERLLTYTYLWSKFDSLDQKSRVTQLVHAANHDQLTVLGAMLGHPLEPMVNEEVKERVLAERAKRLTPRDYDNFEQNQILLEFLTMVREWVARWLFNEIHVEISVLRTNFGDEIAKMFEHQTTGIPVKA